MRLVSEVWSLKHSTPRDELGGAAVFDFEVYVLMSMELRLGMASDPAKKLRLQHKLAEHGLTTEDGKRIHGQVLEALVDEDSFFTNLKKLLGTQTDAKEVVFASGLWPEFEFKANSNDDGQIRSARYWHTRKPAPPSQLDSPNDVAHWSMDLEEFAEHFGPVKLVEQLPLFHEFLPAYEEHQFEWVDKYGQTRDYGAGFSWGLFMSAGQFWD
ncbi:Uncharacterised protein [Mycobacteroides abscessus subsp. abscessus]|nr:Uncharacterised protein [Mycobacteroides abscessus subsp. abscessus]